MYTEAATIVLDRVKTCVSDLTSKKAESNFFINTNTWKFAHLLTAGNFIKRKMSDRKFDRTEEHSDH